MKMTEVKNLVGNVVIMVKECDKYFSQTVRYMKCSTPSKVFSGGQTTATPANTAETNATLQVLMANCLVRTDTEFWNSSALIQNLRAKSCAQQ